MKRLVATALLAIHLAVGGACGEVIPGVVDAGPPEGPDAGPADAAGPDAEPGVTHTGRALFLDVWFRGVGESDLGRGELLDVAFQSRAEAIAPSYEESPGSFGCKVTELPPASLAPQGVDEGTFQFSATSGAPLPPCVFVAGRGYRCVGTSGSGGDIYIAIPEFAVFGLTNPNVTFSPDDTGRVLEVTGASNPSNNGQFAVLRPEKDPHTLLFVNTQSGAAPEPKTAADFFTVAGFGPTRDTELPSDAQVTFGLTAGGDGHVDGFAHPLDIGDSFVLDDDSTKVIIDIPIDSSPFTIGCSGAGGSCGVASVSLLQIIATDGDIAPASPEFLLPPPRKKAISIFCVSLGGSVTVDAIASRYIDDINPSRIRTIFARANEQLVQQPRVDMHLYAGHAVGGLTTFEASSAR